MTCPNDNGKFGLRMTQQPQIHFFERLYPSANMILIRGEHPVLVDTGFGGDLAHTEALLRQVGQAPEGLALIVNTHYHIDHTGGNYGLQQSHNIPIAAHRWDAQLINQRDPEACSAEWLNQPIEPYRVNRSLAEGDEIDTGSVVLQVLHTPGHTLGHIALYAPREQVLLCGDAFHRDDVAWLGIFREGAGATYRSMETLDRLARLPLRLAYSGHGPAIEDPLASINAARRRYEKWLQAPEKLAWHACKRIFTYALMLTGGMQDDETTLTHYLLQQPWYLDYTRYVFRCDPSAFVPTFKQELLRSKAVAQRDGLLIALTPFNPPPPQWSPRYSRPRVWPL